jgi:predicted SprT family Zn-dependent metalloprotease
MDDDVDSELMSEIIRRRTADLRREWWQVMLAYFSEHEWRRVREPVISINTTMREWGRWTGGYVRQIELSWRLLWEHPWYAVTEVFRHEIAHQLADEFYGIGMEAPHGPIFRLICERIAANPAASGTYPLLDQRLQSDDEDSEENRILQKVRKLTALAEGTSRHEAEAALLKARELMQRHDVDPGRVAANSEMIAVSVGPVLRRRLSHHHMLALVLQDFYAVNVIWVPSPMPLAAGVGKGVRAGEPEWGTTLELCGRIRDVRLAGYAHDYITRYIEQSWQALPTAMRRGQNGRRDFAMGVLGGFREALEGQNRRPECRALVRQQDPELNAFYERRHPHVRTRSGGRLQLNHELVRAGKDAGRQLRIRPGVDGSGKDAGRLLRG